MIPIPNTIKQKQKWHWENVNIYKCILKNFISQLYMESVDFLLLHYGNEIILLATFHKSYHQYDKHGLRRTAETLAIIELERNKMSMWFALETVYFQLNKNNGTHFGTLNIKCDTQPNRTQLVSIENITLLKIVCWTIHIVHILHVSAKAIIWLSCVLCFL